MVSGGKSRANPDRGAKRGEKPDIKLRAERLAEALRANLRRRKVQARGRTGDERASSGRADQTREDKDG